MANSELVLGSTEGRPIRLKSVKIVYPDGVKSYSQILDSLHDDIMAELQANKIPILRWGNAYLYINRIQNDEFTFNCTTISTTEFNSYALVVKTSGSQYLKYGYASSTSTGTFVDNSSAVPSATSAAFELFEQVVD